MPVIIREKQWDVDDAGIACIITPGIPVQNVELVPSLRMDREISRLTDERDRLASRISEAGNDLDVVAAALSDMTALRELVTAEPPA